MTISLVMIVRDEERCIARALKSAACLVDEMIVVDTGSVDDTSAIAQAHGATVSSFTWVDDFGAARNAAIERAHGDYFMVLDADESLVTTASDPLREWVASAHIATAGSIRVSSATDSDGARIESVVTSVRLLPSKARYHGRVHENPRGFQRLTPVNGVNITHDGYEPQQILRKRGRNESLLRVALAEDPDDAFHLFQLGRERQIVGDLAEATRLFEAALDAGNDRDPWRDELQARLLFVLGRGGHPEKALTRASSFLQAPHLSAEVLFSAGNLFLDVALIRPSSANELVDMAVRAWLTCLDIGEPDAGRDTTPGCGSFLAAENLAAVCEARGDTQGRLHWATVAADLRARQ